MKVSSFKLSAAGVALCFSLLSAPANAWWFFGKPSKSEATITEAVAKSGGEFDRKSNDFDILLNAVTAAGLGDALANPDASLTVFGPTDAAFVRLARDLGYEGHREDEAFDTIVAALTELGGGDPIPLLTNVLLYHVSPGEQKAWQILRSGSVETLLEGATILPVRSTLVDNDPEFSNPRLRFWSRGIGASNGVIYKIDRVLIPADLPAPGQDELLTITGTVAASGGEFDHDLNDFDILLNAVLAAGLEGALDNPNSPLTVFAPTDLAFVKLAQDLGYHGRDEAEAFTFIATALTELGGGELVPILTNVLLYHVSPNVLTLKDVLEAEQVTTLLDGATFSSKGFSLQDNAPSLQNPRLDVNGGNILTVNGRIHPITRVLIPIALP
ncbi:MAG: fasciclin domain-containing protein [Pseudomonadales bacterium]|nr:fasciclin domain-containing protein [Pseudomonadales bacterium]